MQAELLPSLARTEAEPMVDIDVTSEPWSANFSGLVALPVRLPQQDAARVACDNHVLAHAACSELVLDGIAYRWRWHAADSTQVRVPEITRIALTQSNTWCTLVLQRESAQGPGFGIELEGLEGDALKLAAAHRYSALVEHLDTLTGGSWQIGAVSRGGLEPIRGAGSSLRYGFTLRRSRCRCRCRCRTRAQRSSANARQRTSHVVACKGPPAASRCGAEQRLGRGASRLVVTPSRHPRATARPAGRWRRALGFCRRPRDRLLRRLARWRRPLQRQARRP